MPTLFNSLLLYVLLTQGVVPAKGGTVAGAVRGYNGSPVALVRVAVMAMPEAGRELWGEGTLVSQADTDDAGKFQLENVPPGRYYLVVGRLSNPTFYPGVTDIASAKTIQVVANETVPNIDFQLAGLIGTPAFAADAKDTRPRYRVIALVREDSTDRLLAGEDIELVHPSKEVLRLTVNAQGLVTFPRVVPGTYVLRLAAKGFDVSEKNVVVTEGSVQVELRARKKP